MSEKNEKRDRAVSAKVQNRIDIIKIEINNKRKRSQIIQYIRENHREWKVSIGTIDSYIRKARQQMVEDATQTVNMLKAEAANDLRYLYRVALDKEDFSVALRARTELNKLYALHGSTGIAREEEDFERDVTPQEVQEHLDNIFEGRMIEVSNPPEKPGATASGEGRTVKQPGDSADIEKAKFAELGL